MNYKLLNRIFAVVVTAISAIVFLMTVQPSVAFWDCGEFAAASYSLQVPHPPGAPGFLLIGKIFSMIPFVENIALRINIMSALASAFSVFFLYLVIVKLIENYRGREPKNTLDALVTYISAAIGALSFSFSDTLWFSAVESEVYAVSTLLFGAIVYLMMLWNDKADHKDNEKYILMIAYLIGLSTAVHLMSVLSIISVVMVIMFKKYVDDDAALKKTGYIFLGHFAVLMIIAFALWAGQTANTPPSGEEYQSFDSRFKMIFAGISVLAIIAFRKQLLNRNSFYMAFIIGGVSLVITYPGIVKVLPGLLTKLSGDSSTAATVAFFAIFAALGFMTYYGIKNKKPTLHLASLSIIFTLLGFATYAMVIIRSNVDTPMNENEPNDFPELVSYLNREQYGDFPTFKRRFATEPHQMVVYNEYTSDLDFWYRYQMNHMMTRYWLWNYAGRESWYQDSGVNIAPFNGVGNLLGKIINIHFGGETKDSLFGIPFILGLLGIYFHFRKDWKMASIFMVMFIFMGYLTAFYQNQQQPQPRERDYFYVGAFFVFSIWIGFAIRGIVDFIEQKWAGQSFAKPAVYATLAFGIIFVPVRMVQANYHTHDRSNNFVPWDYSYNLLQSCAADALLFTNGDNDTFPLWYLQDVEGVRRDIRIVNLSLLNTNWYIKQLKNLEPYGTKKVKITIPDEVIDQLRPTEFNPQVLSVPVSKDVFAKFGVTDSAMLNAGKITWTMNNTMEYQGIKGIRVQDVVTKDIVENNLWERPIYFSVTCTEDSKIGLSDYLKMEGMAMRLVPEKRKPNVEFVNEPVLRKQLLDEPAGYSKNYQPGLKFRGLNDPNMFFDENHERLTQNYRNSFIRLALYYQNSGTPQKALEILDAMDRKIPRKNISIDYRLLSDIGDLYFAAGGKKQYTEISKEVEAEALKKIDENPKDVSSYYNPYRLLLEIYEKRPDYDKAINVLTRLLVYYPEDPGIKAKIDHYKGLKSGAIPPETAK
ncbi:MAG: DUF2723 domain-containing protein [Ignavibacteriales bacterium]|nr:DUF2723 domain-containing protein [Ignavibacteriales bacterium]